MYLSLYKTCMSLADSLREGYSHLRALVMAYGDISPQSPLSMMSSSQQTTHQTSTTLSSSERTTPQINEENPSLIEGFPDVVSQPEQAHSAPRSWSRPQSQQSRSTPSSRPISGMDRPQNRTPVSQNVLTYSTTPSLCKRWWYFYVNTGLGTVFADQWQYWLYFILCSKLEFHGTCLMFNINSSFQIKVVGVIRWSRLPWLAGKQYHMKTQMQGKNWCLHDLYYTHTQDLITNINFTMTALDP